jgi:hypothetical protein
MSPTEITGLRATDLTASRALRGSVPAVFLDNNDNRDTTPGVV